MAAQYPNVFRHMTRTGHRYDNTGHRYDNGSRHIDCDADPVTPWRHGRDVAKAIRQVGILNPSEFRGNYSAALSNMKLVHWPLMGGLLHLVQRGEEWARPLLAVQM